MEREDFAIIAPLAKEYCSHVFVLSLLCIRPQDIQWPAEVILSCSQGDSAPLSIACLKTILQQKGAFIALLSRKTL